MLRFLILALLIATPVWASGTPSQPAAPAPIIPFAPATKPPPFPTTIGSGTAVEGDLVSVNGSAVKLWGIDAPDAGQTCQTKANQPYDCFTRAKDELSRLVGANQVTCYVRGTDRNGQSIGTCAVNGLDLAALMVRNGWAFAYTELTPQYADLEGYAQTRVRGVWGGRAESPWHYRSRVAAERLRDRNK